MKSLFDWIEKRFPIGQFIHKHVFSYQVPSTLNVWYVFGLLALVFVLNQFLSGLWLAMFYIPTVKDAFSSIQFIMHQVPSGWFIRYLHTTGASFLFIVLYLHMARALLYGSYRAPREIVWFLGLFLWLVMMIEAFMGYVLPWGQMSYWGAEVMSSTLNSIPWIGQGLHDWLQGGSQLGQSLLQRFFALHIIALPFLIFLMIKFHIIAIRCVGSSEPVEPKKPSKRIPFFPDHVLKEVFPISIFVTLFFLCVFFTPSFGGLFIEALNHVPANPMHTPSLIHPPWYIAPFFTILRAIPNLSMGLLLTLLSLVCWFFLPFLDKSSERLLRNKHLIFQIFVGMFLLDVLTLGILAWYEVTSVNLFIARLATFFYFGFFLLMPWYSKC